MAAPLAQLKAAGGDESMETSCRGLAGITGSHKGAVSDLRTLAAPHLLPAGGRRTRRPTPPIAAPGPVRCCASTAGMFAQRLLRGTEVAWAGPSLPQHSPGIVQNLPRESQQLPVFPLTLSLSFRSLMCRTA